MVYSNLNAVLFRKIGPLYLTSYWSNIFFLVWRQMKHLQEDVEKEKGGILEGGGSKKQRKGRKQKISCGHDVSSNDHPGISANS